MILSYMAYKTPQAIYSMLTQEIGDIINDYTEQCMEGD